jgi:hypothetical protein
MRIYNKNNKSAIRKTQKENYFKKEIKVCFSCKKNGAETSFRFDDRYCRACRAKKQCARDLKRRQAGFCRCGRTPEEGLSNCVICREKSRNRARQNKLAVITAYGGKCQCPGGCQITEPDFLTVDHPNGDGAKHRADTGLVGSAFYSWLKLNNFPKEYRLLCWNCNVSRYQFEACPHERKQIMDAPLSVVLASSL